MRKYIAMLYDELCLYLGEIKHIIITEEFYNFLVNTFVEHKLKKKSIPKTIYGYKYIVVPNIKMFDGKPYKIVRKE